MLTLSCSHFEPLRKSGGCAYTCRQGEVCSPRLSCIRGDAPLNVNVSGHMLSFCVSSTGGAIDEGLRSNPAPRYVLRHHFNAKIPPHGSMPANLRFEGTRRRRRRAL